MAKQDTQRQPIRIPEGIVAGVLILTPLVCSWVAVSMHSLRVLSHPTPYVLTSADGEELARIGVPTREELQRIRSSYQDSLPAWIASPDDELFGDETEDAVLLMTKEVTRATEAAEVLREQIATLIRKRLPSKYAARKRVRIADEVLESVIEQELVLGRDVDFGGTAGVQPMFRAFAIVGQPSTTMQSKIKAENHRLVTESRVRLLSSIGLALLSTLLAISIFFWFHLRRPQSKPIIAAIMAGAIGAAGVFSSMLLIPLNVY